MGFSLVFTLFLTCVCWPGQKQIHRQNSIGVSIEADPSSEQQHWVGLKLVWGFVVVHTKLTLLGRLELEVFTVDLMALSQLPLLLLNSVTPFLQNLD